MSSVNGAPDWSNVFKDVRKKQENKLYKQLIVGAIVICLIFYFLKSSSKNTRNSGESCRYHSDCKNKNCKCKNGSNMCLATSKRCTV
jgi:hypothetical protein